MLSFFFLYKVLCAFAGVKKVRKGLTNDWRNTNENPQEGHYLFLLPLSRQVQLS